jgi:hypothetical protein
MERSAVTEASGDTSDQLTSSRDPSLRNPHGAKKAKMSHTTPLPSFTGPDADARLRRVLKARFFQSNRCKYAGFSPRAIKYSAKQHGRPLIEHLGYSAARFDTTKPGFIANDSDYQEKDSSYTGKVYTVEDLLSMGFRLVRWDGRFVRHPRRDVV